MIDLNMIVSIICRSFNFTVFIFSKRQIYFYIDPTILFRMKLFSFLLYLKVVKFVNYTRNYPLNLFGQVPLFFTLIVFEAIWEVIKLK